MAKAKSASRSVSRKPAKSLSRFTVKKISRDLVENLFLSAVASTFVYEILVSSPWWSGTRHDNFAMLFKLTVPSIILLLFAYYSLQKKERYYALALPVYIISLQVAVLFTIYGTLLGLLP